MKKALAILLMIFMLAGISSAESISTVHPSPEWLGENTAPLINAMLSLSASDTYRLMIALPENLQALLSPASSYEAAPSVVICAPDNASATAFIQSMGGMPGILDTSAENAENLYVNMVSAMLYQFCTTEELALSNAIVLSDYLHCSVPVSSALTFYAPSGGSAGNALMVQNNYKDGVISMTAHWMPAALLNDLQNPDSTVCAMLGSIGAEIIRSADAESGFTADISVPDEIPFADEAWLTETAMTFAADIVAKAADPDYAAYFTESTEVLDICVQIGAIDLSAADVGSIIYHTPDQYLTAYRIGADDPDSELFNEYMAWKIGNLTLQSRVNAADASTIAACAIFNSSEAMAAAADYLACTVIIDCGGSYDIGVSFGTASEGIIVVNARPIPAY